VVVVGAGPAGATLACELARRGVDVLVLEKERLPRYKACAGGITVKAAGLLGFDVAAVAEQTVRGVRVVYKGKKEFTKWYDKPLFYTVMRQEFDHLLVQRAEDAGANVASGRRVDRLSVGPDGVEVEADGRLFRCRVVAGADGARGVVAGSLGLAGGIQIGMGMETEVQVPDSSLRDWDSLMGLALGHMRGGYGWVFPKRDHLSVGIGGPMRQVKKLRRGYYRALKAHRLDGFQPNTVRSHLLPVARRGMAIQRDRALLLGDAAGLLDPLTGEGICHAVRSAQVAAPVVAECLANDRVDLGPYQGAVDGEIMPELRAARALARVFSWFPWLYFDAIGGSDRLWNASCRLLRGEESYLSLRKRLGVLRFAFDLLTR